MIVSREGEFVLITPPGCERECEELARRAESIGWTESLCRVSEVPEAPEALPHALKPYAGFAKYLVVRSPYERLALLYERDMKSSWMNFARWVTEAEQNRTVRAFYSYWANIFGLVLAERAEPDHFVRVELLRGDLQTVFTRHDVKHLGDVFGMGMAPLERAHWQSCFMKSVNLTERRLEEADEGLQLDGIYSQSGRGVRLLGGVEVANRAWCDTDIKLLGKANLGYFHSSKW